MNTISMSKFLRSDSSSKYLNRKFLLLFLLFLGSQMMFSQNKKDLRATVLRLQADSTNFEKKISDNLGDIAKLNGDILEVRGSNQELQSQMVDLKIKLKTKDSLAQAVKYLNDSIHRVNTRLDSIHSYAKIIYFVKAFYNSLEMSDEENLRQFEHGNVKFDLENFYSLISKNARYSAGRVKNLSDEKNHDKYFIMLENIVDIQFSMDKILVRTNVMYSGENMGLFYNREQLTLQENKGLLKLTDWVDLDLYRMTPSMEASVENFTREDFYNWLDGRSR